MQPEVTVPMRLKEVTRYGENSHQKAAIYSDESLREHGSGGVGSATQHHGKEMSYNNYLDAEAAFSMASDFKDPCCVIVKHTNSCGVSVVKEGERDLLEAYRCAVRADPISAFGGIVAFNTTIDEDMAREIREFRSPTDGETRMFYEIVIAPGYTEKGLEVLKGKSKTLRILEAKPRAPSGIGFRQVSAGWLSQEADSLTPEDIEFTCVSEAQPTPAQLDDLKFAWLCVKHVKSNAITIPEGMGPELEGRFAGRAKMVEQFDGFEDFQLLRPVEGRRRGRGLCAGVRCVLPLLVGGQRGEGVPGRRQGDRPSRWLNEGSGCDRLLQQVRCRADDEWRGASLPALECGRAGRPVGRVNGATSRAEDCGLLALRID